MSPRDTPRPRAGQNSLAEARRRLGLTQARLAEELGISERHLRNYEHRPESELPPGVRLALRLRLSQPANS